MSCTLHTTLGDVKIELSCAEAPRLTENWLAHAARGTYTGTQLHRNIAGFLIQGGDPTGTGKGGEAIGGGKLADEFHESLRHDARGVVAMASNGPNTVGCQFYIAYGAQPSLDNVYCVIGRVVEGLDVLDAFEKEPVGAKHRPVKPITIDAVTIHANPFADKSLGL